MSEKPGASTASAWLRLQIGIGLAGGVVWYVGVAVGSEFVSGVGIGLMVVALVLRLPRRRAERSARDEPRG